MKKKLCGSPSPHLSHTYLTKVFGFKRKCPGKGIELLRFGMPLKTVNRIREDLGYPPVYSHKHFYRINSDKSDENTMMFVCEVCGQERPTSRFR